MRLFEWGCSNLVDLGASLLEDLVARSGELRLDGVRERSVAHARAVQPREKVPDQAQEQRHLRLFDRLYD